MLTRYDALYYGLSPLGVPYLAWRWARKRKYRHSAPAMLGRSLPAGSDAARFSEGSVWMHAVSVGEVAAAKVLEPGLRSLFPGLPFVLSTITETGQEAARRSIPGAEAHTYFPADLSWNVRKFLDAFRPRFVFLLESEIWPNFLTMAQRSGARIFLLNGKLSDRSFRRYRLVTPLVKGVFGRIRGFCVQSAADQERFAALGVETDRIRVTGNCKFDLEIEPWSDADRMVRRKELGIDPDQPVVVAGSTHEGEEEMILDVWKKVWEATPGSVLILAPRHPERFGEVTELARARGFEISLFSTAGAGDADGGAAGDSARPKVLILDQMGALARTYGLGDAAIVAGSFCPTGGHNLLEAAAHKIPVLYGPNMKSQRGLDKLFKEGGAGIQVRPEELADALLRLLGDPALRRAEGERAFDVLRSNQGSTDRTMEALRHWMGSNPSG
ncbi:3-deoxy-D-manno-octulosonic acid transferase [Candidatus Sumerlaeota bacterium]|nr:3-deoxy-D-manno-octulosonic acid transferase [Candidatus Sumerlaeota bacterium]